MRTLCSSTKQCGMAGVGHVLSTQDRKSSGCEAKQPKYSKGEGISIIQTFDEKDVGENVVDRRRVISPEEVRGILAKMSDEDIQALGFNPAISKPAWLIFTVLPVPPPPVRPSVMMDSVSRAQDDLTHKLADIVKCNEKIKQLDKIGVAAHVSEDHVALLRYHVITMIDNEIPGVPKSKKRSGQPIKSLRQRIVGKGGRVRQNLMGKRVDFSARTVIGGDPILSIDQVGVPMSIAKTLTYPEYVTVHNIGQLSKLLDNTLRGLYPAIKTVKRRDGEIFDLRYTPADAVTLVPGMIVERHLMDNDYVVFNRQPTLHKMSMMSHRVKVLYYSTFRLNLSVTSPYNADFDGDEMNLHIPQSVQTKSELKNLMTVDKMIVSPQSNKPVMGIVQDTLLGVMKFTRRDTFIDQSMLWNICMWIKEWDGHIPTPAIVFPKKLWTGKQVFSMLLPLDAKRTSYRGKSISYEEADAVPDMQLDDTNVIIEQGQLLAGIIDKQTVGTKMGSLIHILWLDCGPRSCMRFINGLQLVVNYWLTHYGASVGISDMLASDQVLTEISESIQTAKTEVNTLIHLLQSGELDRQAGCSIEETFEQQVNEKLNQAMKNSGKAVRLSLKKKNNIRQMVEAGSKGNNINISQIIACVGQQNVRGKRIGFGFRDRSLPHFVKEDYSAEARGFVESSYIKGLNPSELFFHAMGGREGLVDTAVKTAETGYIQRRLIKACEDLKVTYDGTVRDSLGNIYQFLYGEDGMDGARLERQKLRLIEMDKKSFKKTYFWTAAELSKYTEGVSAGNLKLREEVDQLRGLRMELRKSTYRILRYETTIYVPINLSRMIAQFRNSSISKGKTLSPLYVIRKVNQLITELVVVAGVTKEMMGYGEYDPDGIEEEKDAEDEVDPLGMEAQQNSIFLISCMIRSYLSSKRVIVEHKLTKNTFDTLLKNIKKRFARAIVHPGEIVGTLAAQSLGEPLTQMTLNTFHYAGVSGKSNVTLGVPRFKELINVSKKLKTPSLTVFLKDEYSKDGDMAGKILKRLEYTVLTDITELTEIYYDPDPENTVVEEDREWIETFYEVPDEDYEMSETWPWVLRIVLHNQTKENKRIGNVEIAKLIKQNFGDELKCIFNNDNSDTLVFRVRYSANDGEEAKQVRDIAADQEDLERIPSTMKEIEEKLLSQLTLRGVKGISKIFMRKENKKGFDPRTGEKYTKEDFEFVLDTEGVNFLDVMSVPGVDASRTVSNDILEVYEVLGIEAARAMLLEELFGVISFDSAYVNHRHISILVDCMTTRGYLMSVTRTGINRTNVGPLMRASFEETCEILNEAAIFSELDGLKGVSGNVMVGKVAPAGTGMFDLVLDHGMCEENVKEEKSHAQTRAGDYQTPVFYDMKSPGDMDANENFSPVQEFTDLIEESEEKYQLGAYSPASPTGGYSPSSPGAYSPTSPGYGAASPGYNVASPNYSPTSPTYNVASPNYSPTSPTYNVASPNYSPTSPNYNASSPNYSPTSPNYNASSPNYSPTSPNYSPTSQNYEGASPNYSPTSPVLNAASPDYSPTSPAYNYSPTSPGNYQAASPNYSPTSPQPMEEESE